MEVIGIVLGALVFGVLGAVVLRLAWKRGMLLSTRGLESTSLHSPNSEWWFGR